MKLDQMNLPEEIKTDVKETLKAYDTCHVYQDCETKGYKVLTALMLTAHNQSVIVASFNAKDVFTLEERQLNYANTFFDYPMGYKGSRDYIKMGEMREWRSKHESERPFKIDFDSEGNMVFVEK